MMERELRATGMAGKVAQVTLWFWIIKILATTLGETGGDALSMTLKLGYATSTLIFLGFFVVTVAAQVAFDRYHPVLYWAVIVATTTVGTTTSDYLTRTAGLGYTKASMLLFVLLLAVLAAWRLTTGSISVSRITTRKAEVFYWLAILVSNTLGTALGDFLADTRGFGFEKGAFVFGGAIAVVAVLHLVTSISRPALFWAAFILTRPLGATLGDLLTKPHADGGMDLSRITSSLVILAIMLPLILFASREPERPAPLAAASA